MGTTWQTDLLIGRAFNSCWTLSTSVVPWWNPLWDCWQAILVLITCLQPLPYQGLNLPILEQYAVEEEDGEDCKKLFPDRKHYTWEVMEMVTVSEILLALDFMPSCYFLQNQKKIEQVNLVKAKAYSTQEPCSDKFGSIWLCHKHW